MRIATIVCLCLLGGVAGSALACDLPKLLIVPPRDQIAGREAEVRAAASAYFTGMQAYAACVLDELVAAGGDSAPPVVKRVLVDRNNAAAREMEFMMKVFTNTMRAAGAATDDRAATDPAVPAPTASDAAPPPGA